MGAGGEAARFFVLKNLVIKECELNKFPFYTKR